MTRVAKRDTLAGRARRGAVVVFGAALLLPAGCGADPSTVYRDSAVKALQGGLSECRTAELAGRLWLKGNSTHAFALVVVGASDAGVGADAAWFGGQQPPRRADDAIRRQTTDALDGAASSVQSVRIALDRSAAGSTRAALDELSSACSDLEALAEDLS